MCKRPRADSFGFVSSQWWSVWNYIMIATEIVRAVSIDSLHLTPTVGALLVSYTSNIRFLSRTLSIPDYGSWFPDDAIKYKCGYYDFPFEQRYILILHDLATFTVILIFNLLFKMILAFIQKTNLGFALSVSDFVLFRYTQILTNLQSSSLFQTLNKSDKSLPSC